MRDIKFRAWDKKNKQMYVPVICNGKSADMYGYEIQGTNSDPIMQYTELKDKNGKEIYEGDILKWGNTTSFVVWGLDSWRFNSYMELGDLNLYRYVDTTTNRDIAEVIGNIYENPELLEDKP